MENTTTNGYTKLYQGVIEPSFHACLDQVCKSISWSGVPDFLGPGVMISSWIQAGLSSLLCISFTWRMRLKGHKISTGSKLSWIFELLDTIAGLFLNTCLFLSIAINIGAIVVIASRNYLGEVTQVTLAFQLGLFSNYSLIFLELVHDFMYDAVGVEESLPFGISISNMLLALVMLGLALTSQSTDYIKSPWEINCSLDIIIQLRRITLRAMLAINFSLIVITIIFRLGPSLLDKYHCLGAAETLRRWRRVSKWVFVWSMGILMWFILVMVTILRQLLLKKSGYNSEDTSWSFGQILALGTFLPLVIEAAYICKDGSEKTIQSRVPRGWVVIKVDKATSEDMMSKALLPTVSCEDE